MESHLARRCGGKAGATTGKADSHSSLSFPEGEIDIDTWEDWEKLDHGNQS
jgi:hypothetical protein